VLIARADVALYRARHDRRNRLYAAEYQPTPSQGGRPLVTRSGSAAESARLLPAKVHARRVKSWA
jgi:hypothetical protein